MNVVEIGKTIVKRLADEGYTAYFAGGWVRDLLRGESSDEIDIATSASPSRIVELFDKTITVGISFGVVVVVVEGFYFEISTFRKDRNYRDGRHPEGIDFSTPEKDASRRDFTINGMFYDPLTDKVIDYVGGREDLQHGIIRAIGNADLRFSEDRLRMIRAVRFAARFGFVIEKKTQLGILAQATKLFPAVSIERIWQEFNKMALFGSFAKALIMLHELNLLQTIFPSLKKSFVKDIQQRVRFFSEFPHNCPTILYLIKLFPNLSLEKRIDLCRSLKTSSTDIKLIKRYTQAEDLFSKQPEDVELCRWAHFYAEPTSDLFLKIEASSLSPEQRLSFFNVHQKRKKELLSHIKRIEQKKPLITASVLQKEGIAPGKRMGILLEEAQRIAINENLHNPQRVLEKLKHSTYW